MGIWEFKKLFFVIVAVTLLSTGFTGMSSSVFADKDDKDEKNDYKNHDKDEKKKYKKYDNTTPIINLGFLQLAAHDFFNVNRCLDSEGNPKEDCEVKDSENGKLDLSTVLFNPDGEKNCTFKKSLKQKNGCKLYDDYADVGVPSIANGGELRSVENIMISTASADVGEKYLKLKEKYGEKKAYKKVLNYYHKKLEIAYEESFHLKFPKPKKGEVTQLHNLAIRTGHDFLPADIMFNGKLTSLFAIEPLGEKLSKKEKKQPSSPVDGKFDEEFTGIKFCPIPPTPDFPGFCIEVDLLKADQTFGEQMGLGAGTFDEFMEELEDGEFNKKDKVSKLLKQAFARGLYFK